MVYYMREGGYEIVGVVHCYHDYSSRMDSYFFGEIVEIDKLGTRTTNTLGVMRIL